MCETYFLISLKDVVNILAILWIFMMIILTVYQFKNERKRNQLFKRVETNQDGIEKLMGKPWKVARRLLQAEDKK